MIHKVNLWINRYNSSICLRVLLRFIRDPQKFFQVLGSRFVKYITDVGLYLARTHMQLVANFMITQTSSEQTQNFLFSCGQLEGIGIHSTSLPSPASFASKNSFVIAETLLIGFLSPDDRFIFGLSLNCIISYYLLAIAKVFGLLRWSVDFKNSSLNSPLQKCG